MKKVKMSLEKLPFVIEENKYFHYTEGQLDYTKELIEKNLNKPFDEINTNDVYTITNIIQNLKPNEILYAIVGLIDNYIITEIETAKKTIEKILNKEFNQYKNIIFIINTEPHEITEDEILTIENFEKENNMEITIEE